MARDIRRRRARPATIRNTTEKPVTKIVLARALRCCIQKWLVVRIALSNFSTHTHPTQHIPCVSVLAQLCGVSSVIPSSAEAISTTLTSTYCFTTNSLLTDFTIATIVVGSVPDAGYHTTGAADPTLCSSLQKYPSLCTQQL